MTARLLCSRKLRAHFNQDPNTFCEDVQNGNLEILHNDWPTFLYPEDGYKPEAIDYYTLLQGPFLLVVCHGTSCLICC
jgi:hypothetical protein